MCESNRGGGFEWRDKKSTTPRALVIANEAENIPLDCNLEVFTCPLKYAKDFLSDALIESADRMRR